MSAKFESFTLQDLESYIVNNMKNAFTEVEVKRGHERVFDYPLNEDLSIRLFSTIPNTSNASRSNGSDAIRVAVVSIKDNKFISGTKRVNRTEGAFGRMRERAVSLYKKYSGLNVKCDVCGVGHMAERKGKNGVFYGCTNFPKCTNTKNSL